MIQRQVSLRRRIFLLHNNQQNILIFFSRMQNMELAIVIPVSVPFWPPDLMRSRRSQGISAPPTATLPH